VGVLSVVVAREGWIKVAEIASFLNVAPSSVEAVVFRLPETLFKVDNEGDTFFTFPFLKDFLLDDDRAGAFFIPKAALDTHFTRILSSQPLSDHLLFYFREVLMGVLSVVVAREGWIKVAEIASFLNVAPSSVEAVVFGPANTLFTVNGNKNVNFTLTSFKDFLLDADRAGEYFIPKEALDAHFTQFLSRQPSGPSQSYSRDMLMGVLKVLMVWPSSLSIARIASTLDVDPGTVNGVVSEIQLFHIWADVDVMLLPYVQELLQDVDRAGEFYIPPKDLNPDYASMYAKIKDICRRL